MKTRVQQHVCPCYLSLSCRRNDEAQEHVLEDDTLNVNTGDNLQVLALAVVNEVVRDIRASSCLRVDPSVFQLR